MRVVLSSGVRGVGRAPPDLDSPAGCCRNWIISGEWSYQGRANGCGNNRGTRAALTVDQAIDLSLVHPQCCADPMLFRWGCFGKSTGTARESVFQVPAHRTR